MKKDDIVSVVTLGGEYVGKFVDSDDSKVTIDEPRMVVLSEKGMGFARGIAVTGEENPKTATLRGYTMIIPTNEEVIKAYRKATSGLVTL